MLFGNKSFLGKTLKKLFNQSSFVFPERNFWLCVGVGLGFGVSPRINVSFALVSQCDHVMDWW